MIENDTPRSYASPRDDRFYTPRTIARTNSTSTGTSDEWVTPRDTARSVQSYYSARDGAERESKAHAYTHTQGHTQGQSSFIDNHYFQQNSTSQRGPYAAESKSSSYRVNTNNNSNNGYKQYIAEEDDKHSYTHAHNTHHPYNPHTHTHTHHDTPSPINEQTEIDFSAANIDEDDIEDVFRFARHGRLEEVERLLDKGVPVDVKDMNGNSLLIIACQNGNKRVAKAVLRRGADINARNFKGNTPLHYCFQYGYGETLGQYLISKGANSEARNNAGKFTWQGI